MKNPLTPAGIEPATFRFVAQHLNHCATAVPVCRENFTLFNQVARCSGNNLSLNSSNSEYRLGYWLPSETFRRFSLGFPLPRLPEYQDSISDSTKEIFLYHRIQKGSGRRPASRLLFNGDRALFLQEKSGSKVKQTTHFRLASR